jgi:hypothetical protein
MNIKHHIKWQIENDILLEIELKKIKRNLSKVNREDAKLLTELIELAKKYPTRDIILLTFLDFLQLTNSSDLIKEFDLEDVNVLFKHLCRYNPESYEVHFEYYYFLNNVLDKETEAKKVVEAFIKRMNAKIEEMKKAVKK